MKFSFNTKDLEINKIEKFTSYTDSIPSNTFEYQIPSNLLDENTYNTTSIITKQFNNIYELKDISVSLNIVESSDPLTYELNFKAEDNIFNVKLNTDDADNVYVEKVLPEDINTITTTDTTDTNNTDPEYAISVALALPDELKISTLMSTTPLIPGFKFYSNSDYSLCYVKIITTLGTGLSSGWLALDEKKKFIVVYTFNSDDLSKMNLYDYFQFILPSFVEYKVSDDIIGSTLTTTLNSDQFYYTNDALSSGPINSDLGSIYLAIQGYDLYTSVSTSTNSIDDNKNIYILYFIDVYGTYETFCLEYVENSDNDHIYVTDSSYDSEKESVKCKFFKDTNTDDVYIYVILEDSGLDTDNLSSLTKNKVWLSIGDDNKLELIENMTSSLNVKNILNNSIVTEGFTNSNNTNSNNTNSNNTSGTTFTNIIGYSVSNNPIFNTQKSTTDSCASYCYNLDKPTVGAYFNSDADDINCKCYSQVNMTETGETTDQTILFGTMTMDHKNISDVTRTLTADSADECKSSCLLNDNGTYSSTNKAFTFNGNETADNCTCHESTEISYYEGEGYTTGPIETTEVNADSSVNPL